MQKRKAKEKVLMITSGLAGGSFMALKNLAEADKGKFSYTILGLGRYKNISTKFHIISIPYFRYDGYWGHIAAKYPVLSFLFQIPLYVSAVFLFIFLSPKIIIFNGLATMLPLLPFAVLLRKKIVLSFRSWWDHERFQTIEPLVKFTGRFVDLTYVNSSGTKNNFAKVYPKNRIIVIGHHALPVYFEKRDRKKLRKEYGLENTFTILYVGRIDEEKHCDFMIQLIQKFQKNKKLVFLFVGEGKLKPEIENLQKKITTVRYLGFINDPRKLAELYTIADVLWSNADETYLARPAIEALATGTPLIVFRVPAIGEKILKNMEIPDSIVPADIGWIIDHRKMKESMEFILDLSRSMKAEKKRITAAEYAKKYYYKNPNEKLIEKL